MAFLSVLIGLLIDRYATELTGRRNEQWYRKGFGLLMRHVPRAGGLRGLLLAAIAIAVPALLVAAVTLLLSGMSWLLGFVFATLVLVFMLGPQSALGIAESYADAVRAGRDEEAAEIARSILGDEPPADGVQRTRRVIMKLLVLSGRNLFSVVFWYVLLGPAGAVMFRSADILRHRAEELAGCAETQSAAQRLFGIIEWAPSRLLAGSYALAGSFDDALAERRAYYAECTGRFFEINDDILACTGRGALTLGEDGATESTEMTSALNLLYRSLVIWITTLALLTIFGWL